MKILGINHIGLAAKDPQQARHFFRTILGLPFDGEELVLEQKTNTIMFRAAHTETPQSHGRLEILEHHGEEEGPIKAFLDKRGGGIHHIALQVDNIQQTINYLEQEGVKLIDKTPRDGAHNTRIAFVHPHSTGGFLVEFVEQR